MNDEITTSIPPSKLLELAISKDLDIAKLKELLDLQERWEAKQAKKEYYEARALFQTQCPPIKKNKTRNDGPGKTSYKYADLAQIAEQIKVPLKDSGLSFHFEDKMNGTQIEVTTIITHKSGHSERTTLVAPADSTGSKTGIQAYGSTIQYLRRYGLTGMLGITTADEDNDGVGAQAKGEWNEALKKQITDCKTRVQLSRIWKMNLKLQENAEFKNAVEAQTKVIEATPKVDLP